MPSHLYRRSFPSVGPSVRRSVGPALFSKVKSTHTRRILCRVSGLVSFTFFTQILRYAFAAEILVVLTLIEFIEYFSVTAFGDQIEVFGQWSLVIVARLPGSHTTLPAAPFYFRRGFSAGYAPSQSL